MTNPRVRTVLLPRDATRRDRWTVFLSDPNPAELKGDSADLSDGTVLALTSPGRFKSRWEGIRIFRVCADGLNALHNGWFNAKEKDSIYAAIAAAQAGVSVSDFPAPRVTPGGRRRDYTSASQAHRWLVCPGSVRLSDESAPSVSTSSKYADEGTAAHEMAEDCLLFETDATSMVGVKSRVGVEITEDMVEHVQLYLDTLRADRAAEGGDLLTETDVSVPVAVPHGLVTLRGEFDAILWSPGTHTLRIYDLKFGRGVLVSAVDNPQLRIYLLGGLRMLGSRACQVKHVEVVIVQPRREFVADGVDTRVRRERLSVEALSEWYENVLVPGVAATADPEATFTPSTEGCRWCEVKAFCPALAERSLETAKEAFAMTNDSSPGAELASVPTTSDIEALATLAADGSRKAVKSAKAALARQAADLDSDRTAAILNAAPVLNLWIEAVTEHAHSVLESGGRIPGRKLVKKLGNRTWSPDVESAEIVTAVCEVSNLTEDECFAAPKMLSPAQMEKKMPRDARDIVGMFTYRPERGVVMVPSTDKRPAVNRNLANVFGA